MVGSSRCGLSTVGPVHVGDPALADLRTHGYCIVPGFLAAAELHQAREALWRNFPRPEGYFADPGAAPHARLARSRFAGNLRFPFGGWDLNRLAFHPDLVDAVGRYLGRRDLALYKSELWAKYAGAIDYDQPHHRDFGNHTIVVPRDDGAGAQITTFILLSDVTGPDGPTMIVPVGHTGHHELRRAGSIPLRAAGRLRGAGCSVGREDGLARQCVVAPLGRGHRTHDRARARPVRLPAPW